MWGATMKGMRGSKGNLMRGYKSPMSGLAKGASGQSMKSRLSAFHKSLKKKGM